VTTTAAILAPATFFFDTVVGWQINKEREMKL